ncbi:hypothetical protein, partial [Candidatus Deferrimicrobium sp.]|uniref:hypothetical protein n=1 Tax=Candidatus Deferrimicrobium sp. TaxID=3060586 RepID=UPI003C4BF3B5
YPVFHQVLVERVHFPSQVLPIMNTLTIFSCAASEGGAPFVARRAMNLHGCALPHCAPPPRRRS